ncbi:MAG TPA: glycosyltransferase family 39 protein [Vicinamibacteria bacterium]|nr:glycosyltransferase family 39 protein [Vicinamibacteria bacterium]
MERRGLVAWALALALGWGALASLDYRARDPDSRLYAEMAARMARSPVARWIAPDFPPGWYMSGPFREHPVGLLVPAAAAARLGYPAAQAAYAANAVYQVLTIVLLQRLAATLVPGVEARAVGWLAQLLPIAFTFRIRANHEQAVVLCLAAALYGTERARTRPRWALLTVLALVGLLLVKGVLAAFGPVLCALWLLARRATAEAGAPPDRAAWLSLAAGVVAMAVAASGYELLYRRATGEPFWTFYLARQLGVAAGEGRGFPGVAYNLVFYLARVAWFAFPGSVGLLAAALSSRPPVSGAVDSPSARGARTGGLFAAATLVAYVVLFSLSDRRADRYIFPAYYAVGVAGGVALLRAAAPLGRLAERLDRPWVPAAVWAAAFGAHLLAGRLGLPTVKVWAPSP